MVGGFVQHKELWTCPGNQRQGETRFFTTRKGLNGNDGLFAPKAESRQKFTQYLLALGRCNPPEVFERTRMRIQRFNLTLGKVSDPKRSGVCAIALQDIQFAHQRAHQRGFSGAIATQDTDPIATTQIEMNPTHDDDRAIRLRWLGGIFGPQAAVRIGLRRLWTARIPAIDLNQAGDLFRHLVG